MRRTKGMAVAVTLGVTLIGTQAGPTVAAPTPQPITTVEYMAIADQAMAHNGVLTADQLAQLKTRPDLWDLIPTKAIPDYQMPGWTPESAVTTTATTTTARRLSTAGATTTALTTSTRSVDRYIVYEQGIFNTKVADYHFVTAWSYNGRNVVGTPSSYSYIKNGIGSVRNLGIVANNQYRNYNANGVYAWTVPLTGKWQNCFESSCEYHYPQVRFGVYYNGTYNYTVLDKS